MHLESFAALSQFWGLQQIEATWNYIQLVHVFRTFGKMKTDQDGVNRLSLFFQIFLTQSDPLKSTLQLTCWKAVIVV